MRLTGQGFKTQRRPPSHKPRAVNVGEFLQHLVEGDLSSVPVVVRSMHLSPLTQLARQAEKFNQNTTFHIGDKSNHGKNSYILAASYFIMKPSCFFVGGVSRPPSFSVGPIFSLSGKLAKLRRLQPKKSPLEAGQINFLSSAPLDRPLFDFCRVADAFLSIQKFLPRTAIDPPLTIMSRHYWGVGLLALNSPISI